MAFGFWGAAPPLPPAKIEKYQALYLPIGAGVLDANISPVKSFLLQPGM